MKGAMLQITSSDDPQQNLETVQNMLAEAAAQGAEFCFTPEVTNCVSTSRSRQTDVLQLEWDDKTLTGLRKAADAHALWLSVGSLALKTGDADGRFANRSFLIDPKGEIRARYDKIHMFDVTVSDSESYRESAGYRPGNAAVTAPTPFGTLGLTICYDVRFPALFIALAKAGASIITVPSAFSQITGAAHWETLLRARAIETGAWIIAAAQTGEHTATRGTPRRTYGHSLVVAPWGEIVADGGTTPGIIPFELDPEAVTQARLRIPSLTHTRAFQNPAAK
jgi:predicted amidohydrolase